MTQVEKTAIVTGAGRGIGAAVAKRLAGLGFAVTVNYTRDAGAAASVVKSIEADGGRAVAVQADVGASDGMVALFDAAEQAFGPVDVLVGNAGLMRLSRLHEVSDAEFKAQVAVNLGGVFRGMREGARRVRDGGRIISLSSSVVGLYQPGYGVYAATKAGVEALTHVLAKELGPRHVTVNAVAPGPVATELFLDGKPEEMVANIARMVPLGRLARAEDIAAVVAFLAGPDGGWVNGQVVRANGGAI